MNEKLLERLSTHPALEKHIEELLDIAEDSKGTLKKADDAEIKVVEGIRKMGVTLLQEWAMYQEKETTESWKKKHPKAQGHGKKKSTGQAHLAD